MARLDFILNTIMDLRPRKDAANRAANVYCAGMGIWWYRAAVWCAETRLAGLWFRWMDFVDWQRDRMDGLVVLRVWSEPIWDHGMVEHARHLYVRSPIFNTMHKIREAYVFGV